MADNRSRITKVGQHIIITDQGAFVTKAGAYAEILGDDLRVSSAGAMVEAYGADLQVTSAGAIVEMLYSPEGTVGTFATGRTGNRTVHARLPDEVSDYAFDPKWSWWSIIKGKRSRNYVHNPSFEVNYTVAWGAPSGFSSVARDNAESPGATSGAYTYKLVAPALTGCEIDYIHAAGPAGVATGIGAWTWAMDVYSTVDGYKFGLNIRDVAVPGVNILSNTWILRSGWQRIDVTWVNVASRNVTIRLYVSATNAIANTLYFDRLQLENNRYPTTYFDGDMIGWNDTHPDNSFYWIGAPHTSDSIRAASTNAGGTIESLTEKVGFLTTAIIGLGMHPIDLKTIKLDTGKEILVDSQTQPRDFTVIGRIFGCDWSKLSERRNEIIKLVNPQNNSKREPIILRYQPTRPSGEPYGVALDIKCAYKEGLSGNINTLYQEKIPLQFRASEPAVYELQTMHANVVGRTILVDNQIIYRDKDYLYQNIGIGVTTGYLKDATWMGDIPILVGSFSQISGDVVRHVALWNGTNWVNPQTGDWLDTIGNVLCVDAQPGTIIVGGSFTTLSIAGGNFRKIAKWRESLGAWAEISNGLSGGDVAAVSYSKVNQGIYCGGNFQNDGPVLNPDLQNVAYSDPVTGNWSSLKGGTNGQVWDLLDLEDGRVVVAGEFTSVYTALGSAGPIAASRIAVWNENDDQWSTFFYTSGGQKGFNGPVHSILLGYDGMIYASGIFTQDNAAAYNLRGFARWNGSVWEEILTVTDYAQGVLANHIIEIRQDKDGIIWIITDSADGFIVPNVGLCWMFGWKDGIIYPPPYMHSDYTTIDNGFHCLAFNIHGEMLIGFNDYDALEEMHVPERIEIDYQGTFETQLDLIAEGEFQPSFIQTPQTNAGIYFGVRGDTVIGVLERLFIRPAEAKHRVYTDARATLLNHLNLPATSFGKFKMLPNQTNVISIFIPVIGVGAEFYLQWHNRFSSIDYGAIE